MSMGLSSRNSDDDRRIWPLRGAERGMYIEQMMEPDSVMYNINLALTIRGSSAEKIHDALTKVFGAHEAFHSCFRQEKGEPVRVITDALPAIEDRTTASVSKAVERIERENLPFDLAIIPVRAILYKVEDKLCVLGLCIHHIIFDGRGINLFVEELTEILAGRAIGQSDHDLSYACMVENEKSDKASLEYFKEVFKDGVPVNELLVKGSRPEVHPVSDTVLRYDIPMELTRSLKQTAKKNGVTLFELIFSAVSLAVAKYCVSDDLVIGIPVDTRSDTLKDTVGMFVNTLPVRVKPARDRDTFDYIDEIKANVRETLSHSDCSFEKLTRELAGTREGTAHPLFDVGLNYMHTDFDKEKDGISVHCELFLQMLDRDMNLHFENQGNNKILFRLQFSSEVLEKYIVENFVAQLFEILSRLSEGENTSLRNLMELPDEQIKRLQSFNDTVVNIDGPGLLHKRFEAMADACPDKDAVIASDRTLKFAELDREANKVANSLIAKGFSRGDAAIVMLSRKSDFFAAVLGVLKTGGCFIPTDPSYPEDRIASIVADSGSRFIITDVADSHFDNSISITELLELSDDSRPEVHIESSDLAYMIYTSGSTGRPKGVMIEHRNICNFVADNPYNPFSSNVTERVHVFLAITTVAFDLAIKEYFLPLVNGITVVFANDAETEDPRLLIKLFDKTGADAFNCTPSRLEQYLTVSGFEDAVRRLKFIGCGGERYPSSLLEKLHRICGKDTILVNTYGPTETTVSSNIAVLKDRITVGHPITNVHEYVVDSFGDMLPEGIVGELYIAGAGVGRGYRNPEDNAKGNFGEYNNERVYRSGDFAAWTEDGEVEILGRGDDQVKLRGLRIELGEIEGTIGSFQGITEAAAVIKSINGTEHIAAYYTAEKEIDAYKLKSYLASKLTHYMVPEAYMLLDTMPHTLNGKKDIKRLPDAVLLKSDEEKRLPITNTEKKVFGIAAGIVGTEDFGINTKLHDIGLTSLTMISLMVGLSDEFNVPLRFADLKEYDTVEKLAQHLDESETRTDYEMRSEYPLTMTQYGIYVECLREPDSTIYNNPSLFKLGKGIDISRLKTAVECTIDAHPYLKALLLEKDGQITVSRDDSIRPGVNVIKQEKAPAIDALAKPYDLLKGPLYRADIYDTDEGTYLYLDIHHIVTDGESNKIIRRDIDRAYWGEELKKEAFSGFEAALLEESERSTDAMEKVKEYYRSILEGTESTTVPPRSPEKTDKKVGRLSLEAGLSMNDIEVFLKENGITANTYFNAVFGYSLSVCSYTEEAVFATIYNGRNDSRLKDTVSMLVKTLPVRMTTLPETDVVSELKNLQHQLEGSMEHDSYSFAEIAREYDLNADVLLVYQGETAGGQQDFCGSPAELIRPALNAAKAALTVEVFIRDNRFVYSAEYRPDTFSEGYVNDFLRIFEQISRSLNKAGTLKDVELLYDGAMDAYDRVNQTDVPVEMVSVNKLFERQVSLHPDKTAVTAAGESLTFGELNSLANRVAHAILSLGVEKDNIIGMVLDRTKEVFISEHGILKSGAAFLPMVPEYPDDRIEYCLVDAGSPYCITTAAIKAERPELFSEDKPYMTLTVEELIANPDDTNPDLAIDMDSLAYCIYTSGSTGKPKGVMIEHHNMCNYLHSNKLHPTSYYHTVDINAALSVTSISFDMSITERFVSLCNGVPVVMATLDEIHDPISLSKLMLLHGTESIVCTPSYLTSLLDVEEMLPAIARLKAYHVGGEAFPPALIDRLKKLNPSSHVMNGYGPTETSVSCSSSEILPDKPVTIGRPEANVQYYVMGKNGKLLPEGAMGELIICGEGVGRGYIGLPERTAASFFNCMGRRAYHSGDLVRFNSFGEYDFFGRLDNQVKLRGLRVELDEIENVISEYKGIKLSKVIVRNNGSEDYLAGFFTAESRVAISALTDYMRTRLTPYMIPDVLKQLDEMPLNVNGKIDKKKLPDVCFEKSASEYVEPESETERLFCDRFAEVLKLDRVGATDNFFEIGGTSLSVPMVVSFAMRNGWDLVYKNVFEYPTPRALAAFVGKSTKDKVSPSAGSASVVQMDIMHSGSEHREKKDVYAEVLEFNREKYLNDIPFRTDKSSAASELGNVLLTGATGFLGIHVLNELVCGGSNKVYCLVRAGKNGNIRKRLETLAMYYSHDKLYDVIKSEDERIEIIEGDVTDENLADKLSEYAIDTIINCAAVVKHFETGDLIERVNLGGVKNLIPIAIEKRALFIQISTGSIAGQSVGGSVPDGVVLKEDRYDIGQTPTTKYSKAKYDAEGEILKAIREKSLRAKIMRVGNLMGRRSDGEFQINFKTNGFMNRLRAYRLLGCFPVNDLDTEVDFSPIDMTAKAIVLLAGTPDKYTVFHPSNCHHVHMANVLEALREEDANIEIVSGEEFSRRFSSFMADDKKSLQVSSLISYRSNEGEDTRRIGCDNHFTVKALYRLGFSWPVITPDYIRKAYRALATLGFFDEGELI